MTIASARQIAGWAGLAVVAGLILVAQGEAFSQQDETKPGDPGDAEVTYTGDVAAILQENCQICHQPNAIAPMSLTSYDEVRPWAPLIKDQVVNRLMPPYHYDPHVGIQELKDDWRLSEDEIQTIAAWVDAGAPEGDPADMPPPPDLPDPLEWQLARELGPPDHVVPTTPFTVPAEGGDLWWNPVTDAELEEDRWIRAIEVRPTSQEGLQVVHHANPGFMVYDEEAGVWDRRGFLSEYAMGKVGEILPDDAARLLEAGSHIGWDVHYYPMGEEVVDDVVELGLWFHPVGYEPRYEQTLRSYSLQGDITLAPHGTAMTQGFHSWDHPVRIDSFQPHGHIRLHAKSMEVYHPDTGERELLSMVRPFSAEWHHSYMFEDHVAPLIPTGSVVIYTAWYDNTANNPLNPDPDQWVTRGSRTTDEMSHAWVGVTHLDEDGYQEILAERRALEEADEFADSDDD